MFLFQQYVQHKLKEQSSLVASVLSENGHIYVCGDAIMAADVRSTVDDILRTNNNQVNLETLIVSTTFAMHLTEIWQLIVPLL